MLYLSVCKPSDREMGENKFKVRAPPQGKSRAEGGCVRQVQSQRRKSDNDAKDHHKH